MEIKTVNDPRKQADRVIAKSEKKLRKATKKAEKVKRRQRKFEKKRSVNWPIYRRRC